MNGTRWQPVHTTGVLWAFVVFAAAYCALSGLAEFRDAILSGSVSGALVLVARGSSIEAFVYDVKLNESWFFGSFLGRLALLAYMAVSALGIALVHGFIQLARRAVLTGRGDS